MKRTGDEYFDSKKFRKLLSDYEQCSEGHEPVFLDPDDLAEIADYYQFIGEREKAYEVIDTALSINPTAIFPLVFKAHDAIERGDIEEAKECAEAILDKTDPEYIYLSAEIMIANGQPQDADAYLKDYLDRQDEADREDVIIDVTRTFVDFEEFNIAQKWLAMATDTDHNDFKELSARILFGKGRYKESIGFFRELIDRNPFSKRNWQGLASAQYMNEDFSDSVESSEYAIAIDPDDPHSLLAKANAMFRLDNYKEAQEYYRRYCEHIPTDDYGEYCQGISLVCLERYQEAVEHLNKALAIGGDYSPNAPSIYQELAFAYAGMKEFDKALDCIKATERLSCDHVEMDVIKGHVLLMADKFREAEQVFKGAIQATDAPDVTLTRIVASLQENGYCEAGYDVFMQLIQAYGDSLSNGFSYMALCCNDLRRPAEFLKYLKIACERNPKEAKMALGRLFPPDITADQYYDYARKLWQV